MRFYSKGNLLYLIRGINYKIRRRVALTTYLVFTMDYLTNPIDKTTYLLYEHTPINIKTL